MENTIEVKEHNLRRQLAKVVLELNKQLMKTIAYPDPMPWTPADMSTEVMGHIAHAAAELAKIHRDIVNIQRSRSAE